jgi:hypothetical protein
MITHCLQKGGKHAAPEHIRTMLDCAQICATSADFMLRKSPLHRSTCRTCSEVCEACRASCEAIADDDMMRRCADMCRECAESCREMAGGSESRAA